MTAILTPPALNAALLASLKALHRLFPDYGAGGLQCLPQIRRMIDVCGFRSVLDYGCGKGALVHALNAGLDGRGIAVSGYDPAVEAFAAAPAPADLVVCIDVLDCVPAPVRPALLEHIAGLARSHVLFCIAEPQSRDLWSSAGEVIQRIPLGWEEWHDILADRFCMTGTGAIDDWSVFVATSLHGATSSHGPQAGKEVAA